MILALSEIKFLYIRYANVYISVIQRSFNNVKASRKMGSNKSRRNNEDESERYKGEGEASELLSSLDSKAVATLLRGLADAADNWGHNEL